MVQDKYIDKYITVDELAEYLHVHRTTIYRLLRRRKLPGFRIGNDWRFDVDVIKRWQSDRTKNDYEA